MTLPVQILDRYSVRLSDEQQGLVLGAVRMAGPGDLVRPVEGKWIKSALSGADNALNGLEIGLGVPGASTKGHTFRSADGDNQFTFLNAALAQTGEVAVHLPEALM